MYIHKYLNLVIFIIVFKLFKTRVPILNKKKKSIEKILYLLK